MSTTVTVGGHVFSLQFTAHLIISQKSHLRANTISIERFLLKTCIRGLTTAEERVVGKWLTWIFSRTKCARIQQAAADCMSAHSLWKHFLSLKKWQQIFSYSRCGGLETHVRSREKKNAIKGMARFLKPLEDELRDVFEKYHAGWNILWDLFSTISGSILGYREHHDTF